MRGETKKTILLFAAKLETALNVTIVNEIQNIHRTGSRETGSVGPWFRNID